MAITVTVSYDKGVRSIGRNDRGHETIFDTTEKGGGHNSAASPMEILLEASGACMLMDIIPILRKRRKNVVGLTVEITGDRRDVEPRIYTNVKFIFRLTSPDVEMEEFRRAIDLSLDKYCSVSNTMKLAGAEISYEADIKRETLLSDMERAGMPV